MNTTTQAPDVRGFLDALGIEVRGESNGEERFLCPFCEGEGDGKGAGHFYVNRLGLGFCQKPGCPSHDGRPKGGMNAYQLAVARGLGKAEALALARRFGLGDGDSRSGTGTHPEPKRPPTVHPSPEAAAKALERTVGGRLVASWTYNTADGAESFRELRFALPPDPEDPEGRPRKEYRPLRPVDGRWTVGDPPGPLPLYGLPQLGGAARVFVVEGPKCADAARSIGLDATTSAHGAGCATKSDWTPLAGRDVVILPDADDAGEKYAADVAAILTGLDPPARVKLVRLPDLPEGGDVVDYLDARDAIDPEELARAILAMAEAAPLWTPEAAPTPANGDGQAAPSLDGGLTKALAEAILAERHVARDAGGKLYVFAGGVYTPDGEREVKKAVKRLLDAWGLSEKWSTHRQAEVAEYIRVDAPDLWERPPLDTLNLSNGLLDLATRGLRPHDPAFLSPVQVPVAYDPAATCPAWEKFIRETFPEDALPLPWEIVAWLMLPDTTIQKAVLLLGEGANGKSTFLAAVCALLGKRNVCGLSLHKLESDRFAAARLAGKLANVCPDLPSAHLAGTDTFKRITDGKEPVTAERKYADSFDLHPYARLVFSANHPPRSADATHAFFRRWIVVPFMRTFDPSEQIPRNVLDARLADPRELSGVLNRALAELAGVRANGIAESASMRAAWAEFRETTDPVSVWLDAKSFLDADAIVPKDELRTAYNRDANADQRLTLSPKAFAQALKRSRPPVEEAQRTIGGHVTWVWRGIGLKADALLPPG